MGQPKRNRRDEQPVAKTVNPRYGNATMGDLARALMLPKDPELRAKRIAEWNAERRAGNSGNW